MITEMNASPTPQWLKEFQKEVEEEYKIPHTDAIFIAGKVAKIVRKRDEKACEWLKANTPIIHAEDGDYVRTFGKANISMEAYLHSFRKAMEE